MGTDDADARRIPEELSQEANEKLLTSLARAEKAEKQVQEAVESAARLEQKFMDVMKRIEGNTGMRQRLIVVLADTHTQIEWERMMRMHDEYQKSLARKLMRNFWRQSLVQRRQKNKLRKLWKVQRNWSRNLRMR
jgi:hypothetical protein